MPRRTLTTLFAVVTFALVGLACASGGSSDAPAAAGGTGDAPAGGPAPGTEAAAEGRSIGATVIDVRTPEEFDAVHVDGAELIDVRGADFDTEIAALDPAKTYLVYCRSGNRSAQAVARMRAAGLTALDGGGVEDMTAAGWPTR